MDTGYSAVFQSWGMGLILELAEGSLFLGLFCGALEASLSSLVTQSKLLNSYHAEKLLLVLNDGISYYSWPHILLGFS